MKNTNPKDGIGATKLPLSLVPPTAIAVASLAHFEGSVKYGRWNWRVAGVRASIYLDAAARHLAKWAEGEENDVESGVPHLGHALACINILIDAQACGKLNDDRAPSVDAPAFMATLTPMVKVIAERHAGKNPRHWSIADTGADEPTWDRPEPPLVDLKTLDSCLGAVTGANDVMRGLNIEQVIIDDVDPREDRIVYSTLPVVEPGFLGACPDDCPCNTNPDQPAGQSVGLPGARRNRR